MNAAAAVPSQIEQSPQDRLKITEIFVSLQGEADAAGWPTVFVRLTGCPLRCQYCDTAYAFHGGTWWRSRTSWPRSRARACAMSA